MFFDIVRAIPGLFHEKWIYLVKRAFHVMGVIFPSTANFVVILLKYYFFIYKVYCHASLPGSTGAHYGARQ